MYTRYFGLHQPPFSIAPDPQYLFMSEPHREALAHLLYGLDSGGGFVLLTGEVGAGKTTVCRLFLEQIPARCNVAYIFNPRQTAVELLQSICDEFGVVVSDATAEVAAKTVKQFIDPLNTFLLQAHALQQNNVLIIDEAQNLTLDVLEQLRLLTNLETNERKLLQIVLIGQPELRTMLARPELEQLSQRVIARFHLNALSVPDTAQYIVHRLGVAGMTRSSPFSTAIMRRIHAYAGGIPRRINLLCDRALLGAYARGKPHIDATTLRMAAREIIGTTSIDKPTSTFFRYGVGALGLLSLVGAAGMWAVDRWDIGPRVLLSLDSAVVRPGVTYPAMTKELSKVHVNAAQMQETSVVDSSPSLEHMPLPVAASQPTISANSVIAPPIAGDDAFKLPIPLVISSDTRNLQNALRRLGTLWSLTLGDSEFCQAAQQQSVYCFTGKNGLTEIAQLDRPVILILYDDQNQKYYALLVSLGTNTATLQLGERTDTVALDSLSARWRGGFVTLWRGPLGYPAKNAQPIRGATAQWIASRLIKVAGSLPLSLPRSTEKLEVQLRQFQLAQGLTPDGVARPQTMMRLAVAAGDAGPTLQASNHVVAVMPAGK